MTQNSQQYNRKKLRCANCHVRLLDRFQVTTGEWIAHIKKGELEIYTSWVMIVCPWCSWKYLIEAKTGVVKQVTKPFLEERHNRKKVRCGQCHLRMTDRFQAHDETWMLHSKRGKLELFTSWMVITCPYCRSRYRITAEEGIVERFTNSNFEKKPKDATVRQSKATNGRRREHQEDNRLEG